MGSKGRVHERDYVFWNRRMSRNWLRLETAHSPDPFLMTMIETTSFLTDSLFN